MADQTIEGTWEQILTYGERFAGKRVRLIIVDDENGGTGSPDPTPRQFSTPEDRARAFMEWAASHSRDTPLLSDEAISRESIYGDRE